MVYPYYHKWHYFLLSVGWVTVQCIYPIFFIHSSTYGHLSCFHIVVLEKTLESPLDWKEIKPVHPKGNQTWKFIGRTDAEAETPILWPPDVKSWLIGKDPDTGKDWRREEKGTTEDEMVGWHHRLDGHGSGWTLGVGDGQGGLACCSSWGRKESDTTEQLNWTEPKLPSSVPCAFILMNDTKSAWKTALRACLVVQWLTLHCRCRGRGSDPRSRN